MGIHRFKSTANSTALYIVIMSPGNSWKSENHICQSVRHPYYVMSCWGVSPAEWIHLVPSDTTVTLWSILMTDVIWVLSKLQEYYRWKFIVFIGSVCLVYSVSNIWCFVINLHAITIFTFFFNILTMVMQLPHADSPHAAHYCLEITPVCIYYIHCTLLV